jgi:polyferredoxin
MALTIEIDHAKTRARAAAAAGQPVVPQAVKGRIRRIKWFVLLLTLSIYYVTPFLRWDRGPNAPDPALLLDFAHGRLTSFSRSSGRRTSIWSRGFSFWPRPS